jgi:hypothetical protein
MRSFIPAIGLALCLLTIATSPRSRGDPVPRPPPSPTTAPAPVITRHTDGFAWGTAAVAGASFAVCWLALAAHSHRNPPRKEE